MMQINHKKVILNSGTTTILFFMLALIVVLFMLLSNLNNDVEFKAILIFITVFIGSYLFLFSLSFTDKGQYLRGKNDIRLFFMHDITIGSFAYVGLGIVAVLGVSFASTYISNDTLVNSVIGIGLSGMILLYIFFKTSSVIIVSLVHGAYNSIIYTLRTDIFANQVLGISGIPVPEVGINIGSLDRLISEILNQFFLVSISEEMFKILVISFVLIGLKGTFTSEGGYKYFAGAFAVVLWTAMHLVQSL